MMLHRHFDEKDEQPVQHAQTTEAAQEPEKLLTPARDIAEGDDIIPDVPKRTTRRKMK